MKFEQWAETWLENKRDYVKESTYANYLVAMHNHIIPAFHGSEMGEISNRMIQETIMFWSKKGRLSGNGGLAVKTVKDMIVILKMCLRDYEECYGLEVRNRTMKYPPNKEKGGIRVWSGEQQKQVMKLIRRHLNCETLGYAISLCTGMRIGDADGKISLNQQKPSKHAGLRRFGPEKFLQRNNEFMKERPIFYKKPIKTEKDFSTWLRCFYYTTKAVITEYIFF